MKNSLNSSAQQPMIVKYVEALHNGIQSQALSRYAIGYILRGTKYIYEGDKRPSNKCSFTIRRRTSSVS